MEVVVVDQESKAVVPMKAAGRRRKGSRIEREIVALHEEVGIDALRVPLSGAQQGWKGDLRIGAMTAEVKARKKGTGFAVIGKWLGDFDLLFLRADKSAPLVVMPWRTYVAHARVLAREERRLCEASSSASQSE